MSEEQSRMLPETYTEDDAKNQAPVKAPIKSKIGGQALIEGVMMRGLDKTSMAVRCADGSIDIETWSSGSLTNPKWYRKTPFVRGSVNMVESLIVGYKCLMKSADKAMEGLDEEDDSKSTKSQQEQEPQIDEIKASENEDTSPKISEETIAKEKEPVKEPSKQSQKENKQGNGGGWIAGIGMVLGVGLALLLFMFVPMWITRGISNFIPIGIWKTAIEGILKIAILVGYMWVMSLVKDTRRTFEYHGAEHKSITCYESGADLTVENVKKCVRFHPRCGTSFIIIVLIISILVTSIVTWNTLWLRLIIKIVLLPVVVGISYEIIRIAGRYDNPVTRIVSTPGLALQRITTKEPDNSQIEVAIKALNAVIPENRDIGRW